MRTELQGICFSTNTNEQLSWIKGWVGRVGVKEKYSRLKDNTSPRDWDLNLMYTMLCTGGKGMGFFVLIFFFGLVLTDFFMMNKYIYLPQEIQIHIEIERK